MWGLLVFSLAGLRHKSFHGGQVVSCKFKMIKHEKAYMLNQHVFIAFLFHIFGFLSRDVVEFLIIIKKVVHGNIMSPKSMNIVLKKK